MYIKDTLCWHRRYDLETHDIECIWIELSINKSRPILLGNIYRPPDTSFYLPEDFNEKLETMLERINCEEKETLLLGDMNCDFLKKTSNNPLKHVLSSQGFVQNVKDPTRVTKDSKTLIDVILSNCSQNLPKTIVIESGLSDHHMVGTVRKLNSLKLQPRLITCRNFKNYDREKFISDLKTAPWGKVYTENSVNKAYENFESTVKGIVDKHAPRIKKKVRGIHCPWRTPEISELIKTRDYHLGKEKKSNNNNNWYSYKKYRNKVTASSIRKSKAEI